MHFKNFFVYFGVVASICCLHSSTHAFDNAHRPNRLKRAAVTALLCVTGNRIIATSATSETWLSAARAFGNGISTCGPLAGGIFIGAHAAKSLTQDSTGTTIGSITGGSMGLAVAITSGDAHEFMQPTPALNTFAGLAGCYSGAILNIAAYKTFQQSENYFI